MIIRFGTFTSGVRTYMRIRACDSVKKPLRIAARNCSRPTIVNWNEGPVRAQSVVRLALARIGLVDIEDLGLAAAPAWH